MFEFIAGLFQRRTNPENEDRSQLSSEEIPFVYCLVGNVIGLHFNGLLNREVSGTKHFSAGTKLYCWPVLWGDGYEKIRVMGRHRGSGKLLTMVVPAKYVNNWRLKAVYTPAIVLKMRADGGWTNSEQDKDRINAMLIWLNRK